VEAEKKGRRFWVLIKDKINLEINESLLLEILTKIVFVG